MSMTSAPTTCVQQCLEGSIGIILSVQGAKGSDTKRRPAKPRSSFTTYQSATGLVLHGLILTLHGKSLCCLSM